MSRGGIDYSKWDKFQDSSDDDDDEVIDEERTSLAAPRVTRLDQPSRITTQADGSMLIQQQQQQPVKAVKESSGSSSPTLQKQQEDRQTQSPPAAWTDKGGSNMLSVSFPTTTADDGATSTAAATTATTTVPIYWTQDRYSVTIRIGTFTATTTAIAAAAAAADKKPRYHVQVTNMLSFADRHVATAQHQQQQQPVLTIQPKSANNNNNHKNRTPPPWSIQETLPHPVHRAEDDEDEDDDDDSQKGNTIDWNLETWGSKDSNDNNNMKYLTITLYKAVPMQGLTLWWNRPFLSCPETDISSWRKEATGGNSTSFEQAWKEAHATFKDKMKSQKEERTS